MLKDTIKTLVKTYDGLKLLVVKYENQAEYRDKRTLKEMNYLKETMEDLSNDLKHTSQTSKKGNHFENDIEASKKNNKVK